VFQYLLETRATSFQVYRAVRATGCAVLGKYAVFVYILHSVSLGRYYIGMSINPLHRLKEHRRGQTFATRGASDWVKVYGQRVADCREARALEKLIKARGAKRFLASHPVLPGTLRNALDACANYRQ